MPRDPVDLLIVGVVWLGAIVAVVSWCVAAGRAEREARAKLRGRTEA